MKTLTLAGCAWLALWALETGCGDQAPAAAGSGGAPLAPNGPFSGGAPGGAEAGAGGADQGSYGGAEGAIGGADQGSYAGAGGAAGGPGGGANQSALTLGSIAFTPDRARSASAFIEDGGGSLSVTDAAGLTWTLDIPPQVAFVPWTITMTPIVDVVPAADAPNIEMGVLFEPEGLMFTEPATLTVTLPTTSANPTFYAFTGDGTDLWFASTTQDGPTFTTPISHFSGVGATTEDDMITACARARSAYQAALKQLKALASVPVTLPTPLHFSLDCLQKKSTSEYSADMATVRAFVREVLEPEDDLVAKWGAASLQVQLCADEVDMKADLAPIIPRWEKKLRLLAAVAQDADLYYPVTVATFRLESYLSRLGAMDSSSHASIYRGLASRALAARDEYYKRLHDEHDYQALYAILTLNGDAMRLGDTSDATDLMTLLTRLQKALHFAGSADLAIHTNQPSFLDDAGEPVQGATSQIEVSCANSFQYQMPADVGSSHVGWTFEPHRVTCNFLSGVIDALDDPTGRYCPSHSELAGAPAFTAPFAIEFDACDDQVNYVGFLSAAVTESSSWHCQENCEDPRNNQPCDSTGCSLANQVLALFAAYRDPETRATDAFELRFHPPIKNRSAVAIESRFSGSRTDWKSDGTIDFLLTHAPL